MDSSSAAGGFLRRVPSDSALPGWQHHDSGRYRTGPHTPPAVFAGGDRGWDNNDDSVPGPATARRERRALDPPTGHTQSSNIKRMAVAAAAATRRQRSPQAKPHVAFGRVLYPPARDGSPPASTAAPAPTPTPAARRHQPQQTQQQHQQQHSPPPPVHRRVAAADAAGPPSEPDVSAIHALATRSAAGAAPRRRSAGMGTNAAAGNAGGAAVAAGSPVTLALRLRPGPVVDDSAVDRRFVCGGRAYYADYIFSAPDAAADGASLDAAENGDVTGGDGANGGGGPASAVRGPADDILFPVVPDTVVPPVLAAAMAGTPSVVVAFGGARTGKTTTLFGHGGLFPSYVMQLLHELSRHHLSQLWTVRVALCEVRGDACFDVLAAAGPDATTAMPPRRRLDVGVEPLTTIVVSSVDALAAVAARLPTAAGFGAPFSNTNEACHVVATVTVTPSVAAAGGALSHLMRPFGAVHFVECNHRAWRLDGSADLRPLSLLKGGSVALLNVLAAQLRRHHNHQQLAQLHRSAHNGGATAAAAPTATTATATVHVPYGESTLTALLQPAWQQPAAHTWLLLHVDGTADAAATAATTTTASMASSAAAAAAAAAPRPTAATLSTIDVAARLAGEKFPDGIPAPDYRGTALALHARVESMRLTAAKERAALLAVQAGLRSDCALLRAAYDAAAARGASMAAALAAAGVDGDDADAAAGRAGSHFSELSAAAEAALALTPRATSPAAGIHRRVLAAPAATPPGTASSVSAASAQRAASASPTAAAAAASAAAQRAELHAARGALASTKAMLAEAQALLATVQSENVRLRERAAAAASTASASASTVASNDAGRVGPRSVHGRALCDVLAVLSARGLTALPPAVAAAFAASGRPSGDAVPWEAVAAAATAALLQLTHQTCEREKAFEGAVRRALVFDVAAGASSPGTADDVAEAARAQADRAEELQRELAEAPLLPWQRWRTLLAELRALPAVEPLPLLAGAGDGGCLAVALAPPKRSVLNESLFSLAGTATDFYRYWAAPSAFHVPYGHGADRSPRVGEDAAPRNPWAHATPARAALAADGSPAWIQAAGAASEAAAYSRGAALTASSSPWAPLPQQAPTPSRGGGATFGAAALSAMQGARRTTATAVAAAAAPDVDDDEGDADEALAHQWRPTSGTRWSPVPSAPTPPSRFERLLSDFS